METDPVEEEDVVMEDNGNQEDEELDQHDYEGPYDGKEVVEDRGEDDKSVRKNVRYNLQPVKTKRTCSLARNVSNSPKRVPQPLSPVRPLPTAPKSDYE